MNSSTRSARTVSRFAAFAALATVATLTATVAPATGDDDEVIRPGACTGSADWKLKVKTDDGRLEVEGEVDSNVAGQQWRWPIKHNGSVTARGTGTTTGRSGSFRWSARSSTSPAPTGSCSARSTTDRLPRGQLLTTSPPRRCGAPDQPGGLTRVRWLRNPVVQFLPPGFSPSSWSSSPPAR